MNSQMRSTTLCLTFNNHVTRSFRVTALLVVIRTALKLRQTFEWVVDMHTQVALADTPKLDGSPAITTRDQLLDVAERLFMQ